MQRFNDVSFPPKPWDKRLTEAACADLQPVQTVHENPWYSVRNRGGYFTVEYHTNHVAVLPVIDDRWLVMVRVKRPVVNDITLEFPAGGSDPGEDPVAGAARELEEETGIRIADHSRFVPLPPMSVSSTRMPKLSFIFRLDLCEAEFSARRKHDDEIFSIERIAVSDLPRLVASGAIYVSVPLAMIGMYLSTMLLRAPEVLRSRVNY